MKVYAPGKLILSGEHAVVYQKPAIAVAVNRYTVATVKPHHFPGISFDLSDFSYQKNLSYDALTRLKMRVKERYQRFSRGEFPIRDVLKKPVELAQVAMSLFLEVMPIQGLRGMKIHLQSTIPIGCGMGSSAATIVSVLRAIAQYFQWSLSDENLLKLGLMAENMQHGVSSGLDVQMSFRGGCLWVQESRLEARPLPVGPIYLVNTGTPMSGTGECVSAAAMHFKQSSLGEAFSVVTHAMDSALQAEMKHDVLQAIRENHELLVQIGVVPLKVQQFIRDMESIGGAAKICGAGAVRGEAAGMVWVMTDDLVALHDIAARYQWPVLTVLPESRGVYVD